MKPLIRKSLAAQTAIALLFTTGVGAIAPASAQLVVIDPATVSQTTISAAQNVAQTLKQVQQYQTQLQQYENMLRNTAAPATQIWDQAQSTMTKLRGSIDTLSYYKSSVGSIDSYLAKFKNTAAYRASPCYSVNGCTPAQWAAMKDSENLGSEAQKKATDALFRGLDQQQDAMMSDANQLQRLQSSAQGATGQMQAIGYANQLASHQANQLLQIRGLLIAQQNAMATRDQVLADREAKEAAAAAQLRTGSFRPSSIQNW